MKDDNSKFPWKYSSQSLESLQVCSSMLSFFSALISLKYTIHNTNQQAIKHLLLKTNNKRNRTIGNSVEKSFGYCNQVLDHYNLFFFMSYRSWIAKSGLWSLTGKNCVCRRIVCVCLTILQGWHLKCLCFPGLKSVGTFAQNGLIIDYRSVAKTL